MTLYQLHAQSKVVRSTPPTITYLFQRTFPRQRNFVTLVPGSGSFQPPDLAGLGYGLGLGFCVVFTIIVSLIVTLILITTLTGILP